jgi:hypothetical protein
MWNVQKFLLGVPDYWRTAVVFGAKMAANVYFDENKSRSP